MNDQAIPAAYGRQEDIRFLSGHGRYTADIVLKIAFMQCFCVVLLLRYYHAP